ncbi:putative DNA binding domain-containing protein [bacterium]|nr:putative DNA binding domain-containing protein [bacterium]
MTKLNISRTRDLLQQFDFKTLFIEELGWSQPTNRQPVAWDFDGTRLERRQIAQLSGVVVFEVSSSDDHIPNAKTRAAIHQDISRLHHENLLIFLGQKRTQSLWYYAKREGAKSYPRDHYYFKGQPGDLFFSKLSAMVVDISELDEQGNLPVFEVANHLRKALDVERITQKFYNEFEQEHLAFLELIEGIDDERDRRWYASIVLNRLMFVYFLQRKGFINDGDTFYLQSKLNESRSRSSDLYYRDFLNSLFFEGFAKPEDKRSQKARNLLGKIKYLNGGLFLPHPIETRWQNIQIPDKAFENLLELFERYSWNLNDTPGGEDNEINPDVLGYIFEKYINQKAFGAYYTRTEITEYLCERTIHQLILDRVNRPAVPGVLPARHFDSMAEMLMNLDAPLCRELLTQILPELSLLDPACGSGAFLVAAMKTLINIYSAIIGKINFLSNSSLTKWLNDIEREHQSVAYCIKKRIITENLFGVDIMEEATEIAKLRLFLALVASAQSVGQLEPLPNIDFNILAGNSLIGLMRVNDQEFNQRHAQGNLFVKSYHEVLAEKNRLIDNYRHTASYAEDLRALRDRIEQKKMEATPTLNEILFEDFVKLGIKFEEARWDGTKNKKGKPKKRPLKIADIEALHPFHWGYEFDEIINKRGGFDAIITNPPWEIFKPQAKEFFAEYSGLVTKNKMTIKEFEKEQAKLLRNADIRQAWLEYQSRFPHVSLYFRNAPQYKNQIAVVGGKKVGSDINLFKLFTEQCFNLLRNGGQCGIVIPSGIYTDLGAKQLREMLFNQTEITGLFCFENRKAIFEGVHRSYKFVVLTFRNGARTEAFPSAFMRHNVEELERFPKEGALPLSVDFIRRLSPDSLSVMEFKNEIDVRIAKKMLRFPLLGEKIEGKWNLVLTNEFHMTNDSHLFKIEPGPGRLSLYEGKMIWQFDHRFREPRYWVNETEGRKALLGRQEDKGQVLDYQAYRLGFRDIASNTNERTMVSTIIPPTFHGNKIPTVEIFDEADNRILSNAEQLYLCAVWNSFVVDAMLRMKVTTTLNFFYIYQLPIPRLTEQDLEFAPIVNRAAKLICTTPEFDDLAQEVGLDNHKNGVTDLTERARLRAELDGMIAHLYGLTEEEFSHILGTFPLVELSVKEATLDAYRTLAPNPDDLQLLDMISKGESDRLEFKVAAYWNSFKKTKDSTMRDNITQGVAAFINSTEGGALLIGVDDDCSIVGLEDDYTAVESKKPGRDSYQLFLRNVLSDSLGGDSTSFYTISFHRLEGKDVCRISVKPAKKPMFLKGELYIRGGNQKRKLTPQEAIEYVKQRWG